MNIWHGTSDAPRPPRRVSPQQHVELIMGTWPIEPGQSVWVVCESVNADRHLSGTVAAQWQRNSDTNSYWKARLGPFADGDEVTYAVHGSFSDGHVETAANVIRVKPVLHIAWLWHQHQPLYRDPAATRAAGSYRYPWVRLHAIRDYYSMAATKGTDRGGALDVLRLPHGSHGARWCWVSLKRLSLERTRGGSPTAIDPMDQCYD